MIAYDPEWRLALSDEPDFPREIDPDSPRPAEPVELYEWREYFVKFYDGRPEGWVIIDPKRCYGDICQVRFENAVGLTRIGGLKILVHNRKIGDEQFFGLLDYITDRYPSLVTDFESATGHAYDKGGEAGEDLAYHELLFLWRFLLRENSLESLVDAILADPHRRLRDEVLDSPVEFIVAPDPALVVQGLCGGKDLARINPDHPLAHTPLGKLLNSLAGQSIYPAKLPLRHRFHDVDTHENRFVKHVLESLDRRLVALSASLGKRGSYLNPDLEEALDELRRQASAALEEPFWRDIGPLQIVPVSSQVLQRKEGYRQLYQLYALLQLITRQNYALLDFEHLLETKDTATLFEYWCFFLVKESLDKRLGPPVACRPIISTKPERQTVDRGLRLEYGQNVSLWYNRSCSGVAVGLPGHELSPGDSYSHEFVPDILIYRGGELLVLDAKNKGKNKGRGDFYGEEEEGRVEDCWSEDINKMHAYRDALTGAVGAFALYPGIKAPIYRVPGATRGCEGVGALPLRPRADATPEPEHRRRLGELIASFLAGS